VEPYRSGRISAHQGRLFASRIAGVFFAFSCFFSIWRRMQKSLKSPEYERLIALLVAVRKKADLRQQALAKKLGKPQSFVAKYEGDERRIDLIEFIEIVRAVGGDPVRLFREFVAGKSPAKSARTSPAK